MKLERESGATLLLRRAGLLARNQNLKEASPESVRIALAISDELDGLPLALDQAGAYISETEIDLEEYLSRYRKYGISLLDEVIDEDHASVRVTFGLALAQLSKRGTYGKGAKQLVQLSVTEICINNERTLAQLCEHNGEISCQRCGARVGARAEHRQRLALVFEPSQHELRPQSAQ